VPLIPRYFDLLVLLLERRHEALPRREILDVVWNDVVVSDNALNQAVRIVRRALGDDPRSPSFIRTLSRHGYRFVFPEVVEEPDEGGTDGGGDRLTDAGSPARGSNDGPAADPMQAALDRLLGDGRENENDDDGARRDAAETLHALGTDETLRRLEAFRGHARYHEARALLRDARWEVPGAGPVPLLGRPGGFASLRVLVGLRLRRAWRLAGRRWAAAAAGGALAGLFAGFLGGLVLRFGPGSTATASVLLALPLVGLLIGGLGAAGVGAGLAAAETAIRSFRRTALVLFGAIGGGAIGMAAHLAAMAVLTGLFGRDLSPLGGGFEGFVLGGAAGLGYGLATPTPEGGMATPHGAARFAAALATGLTCAVAAAALAASGRYLGAMSLDFMAHSFRGSQVGLDPLARLLGEAAPGLRTCIVISAAEGLAFGAGLAAGITRRPR
jgi:hypothetical protein